MKVHIIGPMSRGYAMHVHAEGCADAHKAKYAGVDGTSYTFEVDSFKGVVFAIYGPEAGPFFEESGLTEDDWEEFAGEFKVFPCADALPQE